MGSPVLDATSTLLCPHGGPVKHVPSQVRVRVAQQPALVATDLGVVAGCAFAPGGTPSPCTTAQWLVPATRVRASGAPLLLQSSTGLCKNPASAPQGPPSVVVAQPRVKAI